MATGPQFTGGGSGSSTTREREPDERREPRRLDPEDALDGGSGAQPAGDESGSGTGPADSGERFRDELGGDPSGGRSDSSTSPPEPSTGMDDRQGSASQTSARPAQGAERGDGDLGLPGDTRTRVDDLSDEQQRAISEARARVRDRAREKFGVGSGGVETFLTRDSEGNLAVRGRLTESGARAVAKREALDRQARGRSIDVERAKEIGSRAKSSGPRGRALDVEAVERLADDRKRAREAAEDRFKTGLLSGASFAGDSLAVDGRPGRRALDTPNLTRFVRDVERVTGFDVPGEGPVARDVGNRGFGDIPVYIRTGPESVGRSPATRGPAEGSRVEFEDAATRYFSNVREGPLTEGVADFLIQAPFRTFGIPISDKPNVVESERLVEKGAEGVIGGTEFITTLPINALEFSSEAVRQTAAGRGVEFAERTGQAAVTGLGLAAEEGIRDPRGFTAGLIGSTIPIAGGIGAASKFSPRAGRVTSFAVQPGEDIVRAGIRRGVVPERLGTLVPGVRRGQVEPGATRGSSRVGDAFATATGAVRSRAPRVGLERRPGESAVRVDPAFLEGLRSAGVRLERPSFDAPAVPDVLGGARAAAGRVAAPFRRDEFGISPLEGRLISAQINAGARARSAASTVASAPSRAAARVTAPVRRDEFGISPLEGRLLGAQFSAQARAFRAGQRTRARVDDTLAAPSRAAERIASPFRRDEFGLSPLESRILGAGVSGELALRSAASSVRGVAAGARRTGRDVLEAPARAGGIFRESLLSAEVRLETFRRSLSRPELPGRPEFSAPGFVSGIREAPSRAREGVSSTLEDVAGLRDLSLVVGRPPRRGEAPLVVEIDVPDGSGAGAFVRGPGDGPLGPRAGGSGRGRPASGLAGAVRSRRSEAPTGMGGDSMGPRALEIERPRESPEARLERSQTPELGLGALGRASAIGGLASLVDGRSTFAEVGIREGTGSLFDVGTGEGVFQGFGLEQRGDPGELLENPERAESIPRERNVPREDEVLVPREPQLLEPVFRREPRTEPRPEPLVPSGEPTGEVMADLPLFPVESRPSRVPTVAFGSRLFETKLPDVFGLEAPSTSRPKEWHTQTEKQIIEARGGRWSGSGEPGVDGHIGGRPVEVRSARKDDRFRIQKDVHEKLVRENGFYIFTDDKRGVTEVPARELELSGNKWYKDRSYPHRFARVDDVFPAKASGGSARRQTGGFFDGSGGSRRSPGSVLDEFGGLF